MVLAMVKASGPLKRTMPTGPLPLAVATAAMVSVSNPAKLNRLYEAVIATLSGCLFNLSSHNVLLSEGQ